ncbi:putative zn(2)-C6 fungal-type DNA-binding domain-containing protein [Septoria linicola]|nr:putative zn(2)-C6 fungal-type DNA-binding domain-containing protein [Septoria linicola]
MDDNARTKAVLARQTHRKSRFGCLECKRRRVKCGEEKPVCDNCSRRSTLCTYASHQSASATSTGPFVDHTALASLDGLSSHSPSSFNTSAASSPHLSSVFQDTSLNVDQFVTAPAGPTFDLFDLELWSYWSTTICFSFADDDAGDIAWQQNITKIAFKHAYVAQLMLAASALHMSRHDESRKVQCVARSNSLQSSAINGMMGVMAAGTGTNPTELWVAACMLVFCSFGKGPQPGQYMVYSDEGEPEWLGLLQGVKSILEQHRAAIFPEVRPSFDPDENIDRRIDPDEILPGLTTQFERIRKSIETLEAEDSSFSKYLNALEGLYECFAGVFEHRPANLQEILDGGKSDHKLLSAMKVRGRSDVKLCTHLVFAWIYRCREDYLSSVQTRRPMALVILAHYCVLLSLLKDVWYMEGWVDHIMTAVKRDLHPSYQHWLEWPLEHLDHVYREPGQPT